MSWWEGKINLLSHLTDMWLSLFFCTMEKSDQSPIKCDVQVKILCLYCLTTKGQESMGKCFKKQNPERFATKTKKFGT